MSWRTVKLGEIVENFSVKAKELDDYSDLVFCGVSNQDGITVSKYAAEDKIEDYKIIEKGCFAYNPYRINVGSIALLNEDRKGLLSPAYVIFKTKPETIIDELLLKFLRSREGLRQIKLHAKGTVRQALRFEDLCRIELSIPDFEEQKKLFKCLDVQQECANNLTSELNHQLTLVKELRQAYLREAMQGKLVPQDSTDESAVILLERIKAEKEKLIAEKQIKQGKIQEPEKKQSLFDIPTNWMWCLLDDICIYITDGTHQTPFYTPSGRTFLSAQNVKPFRFMPDEHKFISDETYKEYIRNRRAEKGDLLVARVGAGIGEAAVIDKDIDFAFYVSLGLVKPFKRFINSDYVAIVLNSPFGVNYAKGNISSKGGSAGNFNLGRIRSFPFPLPPLAEQERIVAKLEKLMKFCDELEANIRQGITNADSLLQTALKEALEPK